MEEKTDQLEKVTDNYNKVAEELKIVWDLYDGIMEERWRKDEEEWKIWEREEKREAEMKKLNKASEWIQAHWKGVLARKDKGLKKALMWIKKKMKKIRAKRNATKVN
mgnify:CR=1 FL=1